MLTINGIRVIRQAKWRAEKRGEAYHLPKGMLPEDLRQLYDAKIIDKGQHNSILRQRVHSVKNDIQAFEEKFDKTIQELQAEDPFYFFIPNTGHPTPEGRQLLEDYLKPEDIPLVFDSQLAALVCTSPEVGVSGGNGSSKTTTTIIRTIIQATGEIPLSLEGVFPKELLPTKFPQRWRFTGVSTDQLEDTIYPRFKEWVPRRLLKNGKWSDSFMAGKAVLLLYRNNKEIASVQFKTNKQDTCTFQGPDLDGVVYDEEPRKDIYEENLERLRTATRMNIIHGFTPTGGMTWLANHFDGVGSDSNESISYFQLCTVTNKAVNLSITRQKCDKIKGDYEKLKMRLLGAFISLSGLIYGNVFNREVHVVPPFFEDLSEMAKRDYLCLTGWDPHDVTPTACLFLLVDREGICYVDRCYMWPEDTDGIKREFWGVVHQNSYLLGGAIFDASCDRTNYAFGGRNIFVELTSGPNPIPMATKSRKYHNSPNDGVDVIKKKLRASSILKGVTAGEIEEKPLFIIDRPENKVLITSFKTLERDKYANEDSRGEKDRIKEGHHHMHASLRYVFQQNVDWYNPGMRAPQPQYHDEAACF